MVRIKICGITNTEDALQAASEGAHALGFIFASSPRQVTREQARKIVQALPPFVVKVGVFVEQSPREILGIMKDCQLNIIQLHGDYSSKESYELSRQYEVIKVFRVSALSAIEPMKEYAGIAKAFLLDTYSKGVYGGTGETFNWQIALEAKKIGVHVILSGGLNPDNVTGAVETVRPYAIDLSSGVERSPGKKDPEKVRNLFNNLRKQGIL